jgi:hypothetical protein
MIGYTPAQLVSSKVIQLGDHGSDRPTLFHESTHPLSPIPHPLSPIPNPLSPIRPTLSLLLRHFIHDRLEGLNPRVRGDAVTEVEDVARVAGIIL